MQFFSQLFSLGWDATSRDKEHCLVLLDGSLSSMLDIVSMIEIVKRAARLSGGITALAGALKINRQAIYQWSRVPAERVIPVERISGISREELRPDLFGPGAPAFSAPGAPTPNDTEAQIDGSFVRPIHDTVLSQRPTGSSARLSGLDPPDIAPSSSMSSCKQERRPSAKEKS